jgi:N-acetylmuramoyl-L-alanine amidase
MRNRKKIITIKNIKNWRIFVVYIFWTIMIVFFVLLIFASVKKEQSKIKEANTNSAEQPKDEIIASETQKIVCLDPGHGGKDVGAIYGSIYESNINLEVALQTESTLKREGYKVYLTRDSDTTVAKRDRANYCNSINADILVSIHHNTYSLDHSVNYGTALYYKDSDQLLASSILNSTSEELLIKNQGISKFDDSLLWVAKMPAALSEAFFLTNKNEYALLLSPAQTRLSAEARGISTGIVNYFTHPEEIVPSISNDSLNLDRADLGD